MQIRGNDALSVYAGLDCSALVLEGRHPGKSQDTCTLVVWVRRLDSPYLLCGADTIELRREHVEEYNTDVDRQYEGPGTTG